MAVDRTYEALLERMLARVPDGLDKREGSIIFDALAPAAAEMAQMYMELEANTDLFFADTATDGYLERTIAWSGIVRRTATHAQLKGEFTQADGSPAEIPLNSRFSLEMHNYRAIERLAPGVFRLECETEGAEGNRHFGDLLPVDYIPGLARGKLTELIVPGEDRETDEALRVRYFEAVRRPSTSGNKAHYAEWASRIAGVGGARVFPLWNGPKTVKVVIVDTDKHPAAPLLVEQVQRYIDPEPGRGEGQAPIGAVVTVASASSKPVTVRAKVKLAPGYALQTVSDRFWEALERYRKEHALSITYISASVMGSLLLATEGVADYEGLTLNGAAGNVTLNEYEVPLFGPAVLEVG